MIRQGERCRRFTLDFGFELTDPVISRVMKKQLLGRYIVSNPQICHGQPTFRGTRILVADVLEQVASGMAWDAVIDEWRGSFNRNAIAEAARLASESFAERARESGREPVPV